MDAREWKSLPLMMSRAALYQCGLSEKEIKYLIEEKKLNPWYPKDDSKKGKYRKTEVAKIVGLPV